MKGTKKGKRGKGEEERKEREEARRGIKLRIRRKS